MKHKKGSFAIIEVHMVSTQATIFTEEVKFIFRYSEKNQLTPHKFCSELRNKNIIHQGFQCGILNEEVGIGKKDSVINHLYRIKDFKTISPAEDFERYLNQDGFYNLLFHLILGWHHQLEDWKKYETFSVEQAIEKLKKDSQYYEALTTKPMRDADPRDYIIKRSGWMMAGHFGAKTGG